MTQAFADELAHFAETARCPHMSPIIDRLRRQPRVAIHGRVGVGRGAVAAALGGRGVAVRPARAGADGCDVDLLVIAEAAKPEDLAVLASSHRPALIVLTKADLAGSGPGGPMSIAHRRAAAIETATGIATVPMVGPLAALEPLDDDLIAALLSFVTEPADLTSVDAFLEGSHPVEREVRALLAERLDRFGIAHAVLALAGGCTPGDLTAHLRRLGNADGVATALDTASAPVGHLRVRAAVAELRSLAIRLNDDRLTDLAASDAAAMAAMATAVDVIEAAGLAVDRRDTRQAHVGRAIRWRRYGRGPVGDVHRRCAEDIVIGSLRLAGPST